METIQTASVPPTSRFSVGSRIAERYLVRQFIGRGQLGEVYDCADEKLGVMVAVQVLHAAVASRADVRASYLETLRLLTLTAHPRLVNVRQILDSPTAVGVASDLVEGMSLADFIESYGPLAIDIAIDVFAELAGAMVALQESDLIHGAIAPRHILLRQEGDKLVPRLKGFANGALLAKIPELQRDMVGYAPPEAKRGAERDVGFDVYGFGATMLAALTGTVASDESLHTVLQRTDLPAEVASLLKQCMAAEPNSRFRSFVAIFNILTQLQCGAADERSPERPEPGDIIADQYMVERLLGEGGMARVYLARDSVLGTQVAIKLLNATCLSEPAVVERFLTEASIQAKLVHPEPHPNIVAVHRVLHDEPVGFIMEYIEGTALEDYLAAHDLDEATIADIFAQVCDGLAHAHKNRIIHRDLKPSNILIAVVDGKLIAKLMDFGISKQLDQPKTRTNLVLGTLGYISPELFVSAKDAAPASDIYAIGVCLFEALVGELPFAVSGGLRSLAFRVYNEKPATPSSLGAQISPELEALILKCLAKEASERPESAVWLRDRLRSLGSGEPDPALLATVKEFSKEIGARAKTAGTLRGVDRKGAGVTTTRGARGLSTHRSESPGQLGTRRKTGLVLGLIALIVVAGVAGTLVYLFVLSPPATDPAPEAPVAETRAAPKAETKGPEPEPEGSSVLTASMVLGADDLLAQARAQAQAGDKREAIKLYKKAVEKLEADTVSDDQKGSAYAEMATLYEEVAQEVQPPESEVTEEIRKERQSLLASASVAYGQAAALRKDYALFMRKAELDSERGDASSALDALQGAADATDDEESKQAALAKIDELEQLYVGVEEGDEEAETEPAEGEPSDGEPGEKTRRKAIVGPLPANMVEVWIESKPARARVYLDGKRIGKTPLITRLPKTQGKVSLSVKNPGHYDETVVVDGQTGGKFAVELPYRPRKID